MNIDWTRILNFTADEFDDPEHPGSWIHMDPDTIILLDVIREMTEWPIITHNKHGIRGCVCVDPTGHSDTSRHYANHPDGCSAVDFHFVTDAPTRDQAMVMLRSGFPGVGIYYDWSSAPIGFHVDHRDKPQVWTRKKGVYSYILE
mgnify:CR=1 FL=1